MKKVVVLLIIIAVAFGVYSFHTEKEPQEMDCVNSIINTNEQVTIKNLKSKQALHI